VEPDADVDPWRKGRLDAIKRGFKAVGKELRRDVA
jgi:hypothetical protein